MSAARVRLQDPPGLAPRSTTELVESLRQRLAALRLLSGADAFGSLAAGFAQLGRRVAATAEGSRLRDALAGTRAGVNGDAVWSALGIDTLASASPSPVIDHLRNDLALLLADDLEAGLEAAPTPLLSRDAPPENEAPATSVDYLVGMWAFAVEVVRWVEAVTVDAPVPDAVLVPPEPPPPVDGPLLR